MSGSNKSNYQRRNARGGGGRNAAGGGKGGGGWSHGNTDGGGDGGNRGSSRGGDRGGDRGRGRGGRGGGGGDDSGEDLSGKDLNHQPRFKHGHGKPNPQDDVYQFALYPPPPNPAKDMVQTNHFLIKSIPMKLFVYNVTFLFAPRASKSDKEQKGEKHEEQEPRESEMREIRKSEKRTIFKSLRSHAPLDDPSIAWATDYENTIWSMKPFCEEGKAVIPITNVQYRQQNGRLVTLSAVNLTPGDALDFDQGVSLDHRDTPPHANILTGPNCQARTTALNAIVARYVSERPGGVMHVVANKFYKEGAFRDMMYLHAFRGYFTSLRPGSDQILLNVNTITTAFHQPMMVSEFLQMPCLKEYGRKQDFQNLLKGTRVRITYSRENIKRELDEEENRKKTITGFGLGPHNQEVEIEGIRKSVFEHFEKDKKITVYRTDLDCVNVGRAVCQDEKKGKAQDKGQSAASTENTKGPGMDPIWIPPEFLEIDIHQTFRGTMGPTHISEMIRFALRHPAANANLIVNEGLKLLGISPLRSELSDLNLDVEDQLMQVPREILDTPHIRYKKPDGKDIVDEPKCASWNLNKRHFNKPAPKGLVGFIDFRADTKGTSAKSIVKALRDAFDRHGMSNVAVDPPSSKFPGRPHDLGGPETEMVKKFTGLLSEYKICLAILSDSDKKQYSQLKRVFDIDIGVHTVCVTADKVTRSLNDPNFFGNLALKFNLKLGGINHVVEDRLSKNANKSIGDALLKNIIVLGADVVHPPQGSRLGTPSIAAVVGNSDSLVTNFPGSMRLNPGGQETINSLKDMVAERMTAYVTKSKCWPEGILFYRDGVSESQYEQVLAKELPQLKVAVRDFYTRHSPNYLMKAKKDIPITLIIVTKRHHVRFYPSNAEDTYEFKTGKPIQGKDSNLLFNGNVKPGLLVREGVTSVNKQLMDFYLQSHQALQGTARSAHYTVLHNGLKKDANFYHHATHALCYNYARATKGVSYCAPAYYANRLCDRGYHYLRPWMDGSSLPGEPQTDGESDEAFRIRKASDFQRDHAWNSRSDRRNPWHAEMDGVMFYL